MDRGLAIHESLKDAQEGTKPELARLAQGDCVSVCWPLDPLDEGQGRTLFGQIYGQGQGDVLGYIQMTLPKGDPDGYRWPLVELIQDRK